jgi:hypothetical protein
VDKLETLAADLAKSRRKALKNFSKITLTKPAAFLVARLFYNPDCISTMNLKELINGDDVKLADLSIVMMTAAPSTLANYANKHRQLHLEEKDIIDCFACDHLKAVLGNKIDKIYQPEYALSHLLLEGQVLKLHNLFGYKFADIDSTVNNHPIIFKNVLVPAEISVTSGQRVWHHFGVVIKEFKENDIFAKQIHSPDFQELLSKSLIRQIDFSDKKIFRRDILGRIIEEQQNLKKKKKPVSDPAISNIEPVMNETIKFIH